MNRVKCSIFTQIIILIFVATSVRAEIKTIDISGAGKSREQAIKDGMRNAVEKTVGTMISSQTYINNNTLIEDKILTYSAGYVEDYSITSEVNLFGRYTVNMSVKVATMKIVRKLDSLNIGKSAVSGQKFAMQIASKIDADNGALDMIIPAINKYPQASYTINISQPSLLNHTEDVANIKFNYQITFDNGWINEFEQSLSGIAKSKSVPSGVEMLMKDYDESQNHSVVFARSGSSYYGNLIREKDWGVGISKYELPETAYQQIKKQFSQPLRLEIRLYSESHELINSERIDFKVKENRGFLYIPQGGTFEGIYGGTGIISLGVITSGFGLSLHKDYTLSGEKEMRIPLTDLKAVSNVECSFVPGIRIKSRREEIHQDSMANLPTGKIGVTLHDSAGYIIARNVVQGSPAEAAGINATDIIESIDGNSVFGKGIDYAVTLCRGTPGTLVKICIRHKDIDGDEVDCLSVKRVATINNGEINNR